MNYITKDAMKVLDNFLFRCWQVGWLDRYDRKTENCSEKPNNCEDEPQTENLYTDKYGDVWEWRGDAWYCISGCDTCKHRDEEWDSKACDGCCENDDHYEPQTERSER